MWWNNRLLLLVDTTRHSGNGGVVPGTQRGPFVVQNAMLDNRLRLSGYDKVAFQHTNPRRPKAIVE